jgi:general stress protein 26
LAHKVWGGRYLTRQETVAFLNEAKIARFCSLNDDGTVHAAPVWFKYEREKIVIVTPDHSRKARNVKRNKSVTILIDVEQPFKGVLIYGIAKLENKFDLESTAISICEKYMSKEKAKEQWRNVCPLTTDWLKIIVTPENMTTFSF